MTGAVNRDFWIFVSFSNFVAGTVLCDPRLILPLSLTLTLPLIHTHSHPPSLHHHHHLSAPQCVSISRLSAYRPHTHCLGSLAGIFFPWNTVYFSGNFVDSSLCSATVFTLRVQHATCVVVARLWQKQFLLIYFSRVGVSGEVHSYVAVYTRGW